MNVELWQKLIADAAGTNPVETDSTDYALVSDSTGPVSWGASFSEDRVREIVREELKAILLETGGIVAGEIEL